MAYGFSGLAGILIVALAAPHTTIAESAVTTDIVSSLGAVGLIVVIISQIRINSANFYVASIPADVIGHLSPRNLPRRAWVVLLAAVTFTLMLTNVFSYIATTGLARIVTKSWVRVSSSCTCFVSQEIPRSARRDCRSPRFHRMVHRHGVGLLALNYGSPAIAGVAPMISLITNVVLYLTQVGSSRRNRAVDSVEQRVGSGCGTPAPCAVARTQLHHLRNGCPHTAAG